MAFLVLSALREQLPDTFNYFRFVVLLNAAEERAVADFQGVCRQFLDDHCRAALVFELEIPDPSVTTLVVGRKGVAGFRLTVEGREAHSGASHEVGVSAVHELGHLIVAIAGLTDYDREITTNISPISGGSIYNRVAKHAEALFELRAFDSAHFQAAQGQLYEIIKRRYVRSKRDGAVCDVQLEPLHQFEPWSENEGTNSLLRLFQQSGEQCGLPVVSQRRGGGSDGNRLWFTYPTIDGLGPKGANSHCAEHDPANGKEQEYILRSSFVPKALLIVNALQLLSVK